MTVSRRAIGVLLRRWWGEIAFALAWVALLMIAQYTARTPQLFAGSLLVCAVLGGLHYLEGVKCMMREAERAIAAEVVEAVPVPRGTSPRVAEELVADRAMFPRHVMRVWLSPGLLLQMMREGYRTRGMIECAKGIPPDARVLGVSYDPSCNGVFAFVEHESFSPVCPGNEAPLLDVVFREVES